MDGVWFRQKYYVDSGHIKPLAGVRLETYNPFDYYRHGNRVVDNLHLQFANIDIDNEKQVEAFYSKFGPMGFLTREAEPSEKYVIPVDRQGEELENLLTSCWESVKAFRETNTAFRWLLDLNCAINEKDTVTLGALLGCGAQEEKSILARSTTVILQELNSEVRCRVYPQLTFDAASLGISQTIAWHADSLLTALYMMLLSDVLQGVTVRKCEKCKRYFEATRSDVRFCSSQCQGAAKTRKHRLDIERVLKMSQEGESIEDIAIRTGRDVERIKRWIIPLQTDTTKIQPFDLEERPAHASDIKIIKPDDAETMKAGMVANPAGERKRN